MLVLYTYIRANTFYPKYTPRILDTDKTQKMKTIVFICSALVICTKAFLPSEESSDGRADYTHASITEKAIYHAASDVILSIANTRKHSASDIRGTLSKYIGE